MKISRTSTATNGEGRTPSPFGRAGMFRGIMMLLLGVALGGTAVWISVDGSRDRVPADEAPSFDLLASSATADGRTTAFPDGPGDAAQAPSPDPGAEPPAPQQPSEVQSFEDSSAAAGEDRTLEPPAVVESPSLATPPSPAPAPAGPRVDVASGLLENLTTEDRNPPVRLLIPSLGVDAPIDAVGYDRRKDEMEIPRTASIAGWYEYGPSPGETGSSVISAHVDWGGKKGVFFELRNIEPNALIVVEYEDGSRRTFAAVVKNQYDKDELPVNEIFDRTGRPILTLITCGGAFNPSIRSYQDNVVVQAVEVIERQPDLALRSGI